MLEYLFFRTPHSHLRSARSESSSTRRQRSSMLSSTLTKPNASSRSLWPTLSRSADYWRRYVLSLSSLLLPPPPLLLPSRVTADTPKLLPFPPNGRQLCRLSAVRCGAHTPTIPEQSAVWRSAISFQLLAYTSEACHPQPHEGTRSATQYSCRPSSSISVAASCTPWRAACFPSAIELVPTLRPRSAQV